MPLLIHINTIRSYRAIAQRELEDERKKELNDPMAVYQNSAIGEGVGSGTTNIILSNHQIN